MGHRLVKRLTQQDGLGFDAADAIAQHPEAVDHRRVRVRADERVGVGDSAARAIRPIRHDRREILQVHLVDDAGPWRHHAQVAERGLGPAQQLIALAVSLVLALHVEGEGAGRAEAVDLHRVIDDQVCRDERVHRRRIAAEVRHRVAHDREVDDGRDAGEIL